MQARGDVAGLLFQEVTRLFPTANCIGKTVFGNFKGIDQGYRGLGVDFTRHGGDSQVGGQEGKCCQMNGTTCPE